MKDIDQDYKKARYKLCRNTSAAIHEVTGSIDYYGKLIDGDKASLLHNYVEAYQSRLHLKFLEARSSSFHSLASQQHQTLLLEKLVVVFDELATRVEESTRKYFDPSVEMDASAIEHMALNNQAAFDAMSAFNGLQRVKKNIASFRQKNAAFERLHATEIAAEMSSASYKEEQSAIKSALEDLHKASHGQWTPELVTVADYMGTGESKDIESPTSAQLGQIAEAARSGQLRLPPSLLALSNGR